MSDERGTPGVDRRGPPGVARAWVDVLVRPQQFFRSAVVPGNQGAGLVFAMAVVAVEEASRLVLVPDAIPPVVGGPVVSGVLVVGFATLLVAPVGLHLVAALQTLLLRPLVPDRAGVAETVQVVAYAAAPCALAGPPVPWLRALCGLYGTWLLVVGLQTVHGTSRRRAALAGLVIAAIVFGYGFRGFGAVGAQLAAWYII